MRILQTFVAATLLAVSLVAGAAVGRPVDEPPVICGRTLAVVPELSWQQLWPELGLAAIVGEHGTLPANEVPSVVRALEARYRDRHPDAASHRDAQTLLNVLEDVASGRRDVDAVDWAVVPNQEEGRAEIFETLGEAAIHFDCASTAPEPPYREDIARVVRVMAKIRDFAITEKLEWVDFVIRTRARQSQNLLRNGLTMTPWEMKLNERFLTADDAVNGFDRQIVFLRPSAGAEINTRSRAAASLQGSLAIEPIGFVRYLDTDRYDRWWGVSALVTSSTDGGLGYGVLLRYGNYTAGLTRHAARQGGGDDTYLFLGIDLYNLLDSKRPELEAFAAKYRNLVGRVRGGGQ